MIEVSHMPAIARATPFFLSIQLPPGSGAGHEAWLRGVKPQLSVGGGPGSVRSTKAVTRRCSEDDQGVAIVSGAQLQPEILRRVTGD